MKEQIDTDRRIGTTTRLADYYIQRLFKGETCEIIDHRPTKAANRHLVEIIIQRLWNEHQISCLKAANLVNNLDGFKIPPRSVIFDGVSLKLMNE
jgi:hypothetical protein